MKYLNYQMRGLRQDQRMRIIAQRRRKEKKCLRRKSRSQISTMMLVASIRTVSGFLVFPNSPLLARQSWMQPCSFVRRPGERLLALKYADGDDNNTVFSDNDDGTGSSSSSSQNHIVANPADSILSESNAKEADHNPVVNQKSKLASRSTDISDAIKEVLNAPVIPSEETLEDKIRLQRLILPIKSRKAQDFDAVKATNSVTPKSKERESKETVTSLEDTHLLSRFDLKRRWRRLRPSQKFRFRLGLASIAFVSLWNTMIAHNYSGVITSILTGAAATTTATGFGSILRRWLSNRGFQGIAALGRSIAYGWAIFVAYPRMLDRRAKERRLKREEEALKQWRSYLKAIADEVNRLKKELSLLDGEIRTFRREILAIRAARIESTAKSSNINESSNQSDRVLREAIINEMAHLTRLRDDTRLALTTARKQWSEIRSKRPISHSKSSAFDAVELELDIVADFEYGSITTDNMNDDPLLTGF